MRERPGVAVAETVNHDKVVRQTQRQSPPGAWRGSATFPRVEGRAAEDRGMHMFISHRFTFALILSLMGKTAAFAQQKAFECRSGGEMTISEGQALMAKVQAQYAGVEDLHGAFRQESYVAALDESESSGGEMWFAKPGKMRWEYAQPRPQSVVVNQGTLWLYQPDKAQVLIDDIGNVLLSSLPISFMMGVGNLSREFELKGACRGPEGVILRLIPRKTKGESTDALEGFDLLVDAAQSLPKGAKISSLGGNITAIVFSDLVKNGGAKEGRRFVLEYPKGVDVMDRRQSAH